MMLYYSIPLLKIVAPSRMSGTGISYAYMYGALPVSSVFMLIATIERLGDIFGGKS
jgi:TRAP-type C4-dicarboxylate transport system permease small subunit